MSTWFEESFGSDYLTVYKHRDLQGAREEVRKMIDWLRLHPGAEVLDLCCGMGRHSLALADFGYRVTGMDLSPDLLAEAQSIDTEGRVEWIKGDMRRVPIGKAFDAVVNLFTSFGYFDEENDNIRVLKEIERLLKPGGRFIIDYLNAEFTKRHLVAESIRSEGDLLIRESRSVEEGFVRKRVILEKPDCEQRRYREQVRLYGLDDFKRLLHKSGGLRLDGVYGDYDGFPYSAEASPRMILVGTKKEGGQ